MKTLSKRSRAWLDDATTWRLIGMLFERPHADWEANVAALAHEVGGRDLRRAAQAAVGARASDYLAVLGPGGGASPREVAYRTREDPGRILADVAAFYRAFGFEARVEDPPDHVAVEASFVGFLSMKAAYARELEEHEAEATVGAGLEKFVAEHLRRFAEPLAARLAPLGDSYLAIAAQALLARVGPVPKAERAMLHTIPITAAPGLEAEGESFDCGSCSSEQ